MTESEVYMDYIITGNRIRAARAKTGLTQKQLAERLGVTNTAVSKWERGLGMPDISLLLPLCSALGISLTDLLKDQDDTEKKQILDCLSLNQTGEAAPAGSAVRNSVDLRIDVSDLTGLSPYVFGHNIEHTRAAVNGGLSAQMLRNRKFAGKPSKNRGVPAEWIGIGERAFFQTGARPSYTKHICCEKMRRGNELNSLSVQNIIGEIAGIAQKGLAVAENKTYEIRVVTMCSSPISLKAELTSGKGDTVYASHDIALAPGDWQTSGFTLTSPAADAEAAIRFTFEEKTEVVFGAASMLPEGHFHGMRADVVECLKKIGPSIIRWPGGNFAGEYRWKDGLLPVDMRGPMQSANEIETQPYTYGYDFHEISTDDFVALCREVGAEPFITINLFWNTAEESAEWVEYCNGAPDTEYGRKRAENGHPEPYNVRFWSLGNEMGYGHMEGPMTAADYASLASAHADAMLRKSPDLSLFSSGPYPNDRWAVESAARLASKVKYISLHNYSNCHMDYTSDEKTAATYQSIVSSAPGVLKLAKTMRESLDRSGEKLFISFDEWNYWYSWYRPSCVSEGIYTARVLHMLIYESPALGMPVCCYFQPVGEGAVLVTPDSACLTANGQMFALMSGHKGGRLCRIDGDGDHSAVATLKDGIMTLTLINDGYDADREFSFGPAGKIVDSVLYRSDDVRPYTFFETSKLRCTASDGGVRVKLPPHSVGMVKIKIKK